ncbi:MAG: nucleoside monophosphate kinase [Holosporales bacterium]|jgi:adenylate kinase|nr:nucleoside monophosphate kinase [Holosporales bacterium]
MINKYFAIILIGPPGCGKGTQAAFLREKGFAHFAAGDELRKEITSDSDLGKEIKKIYDEGKLVSDDIMNEITRNFVDRSGSTRLLFDGFPRKVSQADFLQSFLIDLVSNGDITVKACFFDIKEDVVAVRVVDRFCCAKCGAIYNRKTMSITDFCCPNCGSNEILRRTDDNEEAVVKRIKTYRIETQPVLDFYEKLGILKVIDASLSVKEVSKKIEKIIGNYGF